MKIREGFAASVVLASAGYPGSYAKGKAIVFDDVPISEDLQVFHAGTKLDGENNILTDGGRVLAVSSYAPTVNEAIQKAYTAINKINFEGMTFRRDIGFRYDCLFFSPT